VGSALESLREEVATLQRALEDIRRERDAVRRQVQAMGPERDHLRARLDEVEAARRDSERSHQAERDRLVAALEQARQASESAARRGAEHAEAVRVLRAERDRHRTDREAREAETRRNLAALQREWESERQCWLAMLSAGRPEDLRDSPVSLKDLVSSLHGDLPQQGIAAERSQDAAAGREAASITPPSRPAKRTARPLRRAEVAAALRPRPQACSYDEPEAFRTDLEQWLAEARPRLQAMSANPGRPANPTFCQWLEYEIRTGREEIALLVQEPAENPGSLR
jgi:hypothetical protein